MRLNYKHLYYYLVVAREGSLIRASEKLNLTPQTISGQLKVFEESIGEKLFTKSGRRLEVTETGRRVLEYADNIFTLGHELEESLRQGLTTRPREFRVGVADVVPKSIAYHFLLPAMQLQSFTRIICHEHEITRLMAELAVHELDMIIADSPMPARVNVRGYNHKLGSSNIAFFAAPSLAESLQGRFPGCLDQVPMILPSQASAIRDPVLQWLERHGVKPHIVGEFDDNALLNAFGARGTGIFFTAAVIGDEICEQLQVQRIGEAVEIQQEFYAITIDRKISHPAIRAITDRARDLLTGSNPIAP